MRTYITVWELGWSNQYREICEKDYCKAVLESKDSWGQQNFLWKDIMLYQYQYTSELFNGNT